MPRFFNQIFAFIAILFSGVGLAFEANEIPLEELNGMWELSELSCANGDFVPIDLERAKEDVKIIRSFKKGAFQGTKKTIRIRDAGCVQTARSKFTIIGNSWFETEETIENGPGCNIPTKAGVEGHGRIEFQAQKIKLTKLDDTHKFCLNGGDVNLVSVKVSDKEARKFLKRAGLTTNDGELATDSPAR